MDASAKFRGTGLRLSDEMDFERIKCPVGVGVGVSGDEGSTTSTLSVDGVCGVARTSSDGVSGESLESVEVVLTGESDRGGR